METRGLRVARASAAALSLLLAPAISHGDAFKRLSPKEVRARMVGKVITDEAHWSDRLMPDGTLESFDMGHAKAGSWKLDGDVLCLTRKERRGTTTDCFEVWLAKDQVELRRDGVTVVEGVLREK
ncbi:MAG TPA: hypothetical protein VLH12_12805 [Usitatibacter sp.]|nr:hypothetical protein [Usitatibacter sp.]